MVDFAVDPFGARFLLQGLAAGSGADRELVFTELLPSAASLSSDACGSPVVQWLFEFGTAEQRLKLAGSLHEQVLGLALNAHGCRVVQKALETLPAEARQAVARELDGNLMKCVQDQNANHVVQQVIAQIRGDGIAWLLRAFEGNIVRLSTHPYGCRIVQRLLEHCTEPQQAVVLGEVFRAAPELLRDSYGNYVLQHIVEHGRPESRAVVLQHIMGSVLPLALHKFASNVVERCLEFCSASEKRAIVDEVLLPSVAVLRAHGGTLPEDGSPQMAPLQVLIRDQFGNYVAQKLLDIADDSQRAVMIEVLLAYAPAMRRYSYGKHILSRLDKMVSARSLLTVPVPPPFHQGGPAPSPAPTPDSAPAAQTGYWAPSDAGGAPPG